MTSLKDVAKLAGVSVGAVSRYLNEPERLRESTRRRIRPAIEALNYSPNALAQSLRRGKTGLVMVICSAIGDPYFGDVIHGIQRAAKERGMTILVREVRSIHERPSEATDIVLSRAADGVIVLGSNSPFDLTDERPQCGGSSARGRRRRDRFGRASAHAVGEDRQCRCGGGADPLPHRARPPSLRLSSPASRIPQCWTTGRSASGTPLPKAALRSWTNLLVHGDLIVDGRPPRDAPLDEPAGRPRRRLSAPTTRWRSAP